MHLPKGNLSFHTLLTNACCLLLTTVFCDSAVRKCTHSPHREFKRLATSKFVVFSNVTRVCGVLKLVCRTSGNGDQHKVWRPLPLGSGWWEIIITALLTETSATASQVIIPARGVFLDVSNLPGMQEQGLPEQCISNGYVHGLFVSFIEGLHELGKQPGLISQSQFPYAYNITDKSVTALAVVWLSDSISLTPTRNLLTGKNIFITSDGDIVPLDFSTLRPRNCTLSPSLVYSPNAMSPAFARGTAIEGCTDIMKRIAQKLLSIIDEVCGGGGGRPLQDCHGIHRWDASALPFFLHDAHMMMFECSKFANKSMQECSDQIGSQLMGRYLNRPGGAECIQRYGRGVREFFVNFLSDAFVAVHRAVWDTYSECTVRSVNAKDVMLNIFQLLLGYVKG